MKAPLTSVQNLYSNTRLANDGGPWSRSDMLRSGISVRVIATFNRKEGKRC